MRHTRRAILIAGSLAATRARGHSGHDEDAIALAFLQAARDPDGSLRVALELRNGGAHAATLRALRTSPPTRLRLERRWRVFGTTLWQPVTRLRLEPATALRLGPPDYRLRIEAHESVLAAGRLLLNADFGPDGQRSAVVLWPAAQTTP